jgi:peptidoglycan/xylan/chitin deacetylase (PgdA/CDA1 family)
VKLLAHIGIVALAFAAGFNFSAKDTRPLPAAPPTIIPAISSPTPAVVPIVPATLISLTFDACPHAGPAGYDAAITSVLVDSAVPATIFMSGQWVEQHPAQARLLSANPLFEIGNHAYSHPHMTRIRSDVVREELVKTEQILKLYQIEHVPLYRPPFGETSPAVDSIVSACGLTTVMYDIASGDPDSSFHRNRLTRSVVGSAKNGSIVVLHINGRGWHTAEALPLIIAELRSRGFRFVKASELLRSAKK